MKKTMLIVLASAIVLATSCSKKNADTPPENTVTVEGYWVGNYNSYLGTQDNLGMLFKPGGVLRVYSLSLTTDTSTLIGNAKVTGEWTKVGNTVTTIYKSGPATITSSKVLNTTNTQMTGTWASNGVTKGAIELNKQ